MKILYKTTHIGLSNHAECIIKWINVRYKLFLQRKVHISLHHRMVPDRLKRGQRIVQFWINSSENHARYMNNFPTQSCKMWITLSQNRACPILHHRIVRVRYSSSQNRVRYEITSSDNHFRNKSLHHRIVSVMNHFLTESRQIWTTFLHNRVKYESLHYRIVSIMNYVIIESCKIWMTSLQKWFRYGSF